ncbi:hypothetical protein [Cellulomonas sp. 73-145]|uniref:hypothetical protein n=1 Tax=Cellulomonas sp. 73-145 TaxID=1895739 RepID=UPI0025C2FEC9|nr:hypothetical protein [Cellulomonas sp. 73-145]
MMVPDSTDARSFIELSSHAADLVQAREALELAVKSREEIGSPLESVRDALIAAAAMAYCRTFFPSNVRRPVTDFITLPEALRATHELVRAFRNRTIAHSQSDLSVTYAVAVLDAQTLEVRDVGAPSIGSTMPPERVRDFLELVTTAQDLLDNAIEPIRDRLMTEMAAADRAALVRRGVRPMVREALAAEFDPSTTRPSYPTSHPVYLSPMVAD